MIREKIIQLELNTTEMKEAISEKEFNDLLKECDLAIKNYDDKPLFIKPYGDSIPKSNLSSTVYKVMNNVIGTSEGEMLSKYVVMNHIEAGMDILEIINLTTFSIETCMNCREQLNMKLDNDRNRYINTRLRTSKLYELL